MLLLLCCGQAAACDRLVWWVELLQLVQWADNDKGKVCQCVEGYFMVDEGNLMDLLRVIY